MEKITKTIFIIVIIGALLLGIGAATAFFGPSMKKLRQERNAYFEQIDEKMQENADLREKILKEREGWMRLIDTLEREIILIDERIANKEAALEEHKNKNNEAIDSLTNLPDSLHQQFLSDQFGIEFD